MNSDIKAVENVEKLLSIFDHDSLQYQRKVEITFRENRSIKK